MPRELPSTTVTQLTPDGRGAVTTLLVSGPGSTDLVGEFFNSAAGRTVKRLPINAICFGQWRQPPGVAEDVVLARRSDTEIEVSCHGGHAAAHAIIGSLEAAGAIRIESDQWIAKATPGRLEADAWIALAEAKTERVAGVLLDQLRGALRGSIQEMLALLDAGDSDAARLLLARLIARAGTGLHLTSPWQVAIIGEPNVGKSSLMNRLAGFDRSIVFDQPGTTRDVLAASTALDGWPVDLLDTAGLRDSEDEVEQEGVRRARRASSLADLTILVVDAQRGLAELDSPLARENPQAIVVANKQDIAADIDWPDKVACTSAVTGAGVASLIERITARLVPDPPSPGEAVPWTTAQLAELHLAYGALDKADPTRCQHFLRSLLSS